MNKYNNEYNFKNIYILDRFYEYKKQRQRDDSDWYFRRAYARRNARRHAEYIYQQSIKGSRIWDWKNRR